MLVLVTYRSHTGFRLVPNVVTLNDLESRTGEPLEVKFLFQRISVLIQRFNSVLFHETFPVDDDTDT